MSRPSDSEIQTASEILKRLDPGYLPRELFFQFTRLSTTAILEIVPLRLNGHRVEVMFFTRPENDPIWAGKLHTPGAVIMPTDVNQKTRGFDKVAAIILDEEMGLSLDNFKKQTGRDLVYSETLLHYPLRGAELANVFYIDLTNIQLGAREGLWLDSNKLPARTVDTQIYFIQKSVNLFRQNLQTQNKSMLN